MPTYQCKNQDCKGTVTFAIEDVRPTAATPEQRKWGDMSLVIIIDEPAECTECGASYYEHELK
jgi:hypothetical protein